MLHKFISGFINKPFRSKVHLLVCFCLFVASNSLKAQQEPMYSQYMFNLLHINPAYAGNRTVDNVTLMYRNQWLGVDGAPVTGTLSWDRRKEESNIGYGLQIYNDRLGVEKTTGVQAFYSYRIPFNRSFLSFGLSAGALSYHAAYSQVTTNQTGDPLFQEDVSAILPTVGIGFLYATDNWYAALSVPALLKTKVTSNNNQVTTGANNHYFLTTGYLFKVSESFKLKPSVMLKAVKGAPFEYDFNLNGWIQDIVGIGASYRTGDAFIGMFELQMTPNIRIGYAYDYLISNLKNYSKGTHELMLRYEFLPAKSKRILSPRYY